MKLWRAIQDWWIGVPFRASVLLKYHRGTRGMLGQTLLSGPSFLVSILGI